MFNGQNKMAPKEFSNNKYQSKLTKLFNMSQYSQASFTVKRRNPYAQTGRPSYKRFKNTPLYPKKKRSYMKKTLRALAPDLSYNTGALAKTDLVTVSGEDSAQQPWRLVSAATFNTGSQPARDQQMFNAYAMGTAPFSRLGNKIVCKGLQLHLKLQSFSQRDVTIRYVLVQKYHCDNQSVVDLSDEDNNPFYLRGTEMLNAALNDPPPSIYNTNNAIMSMRNLNGTKDFKILLDKKVTIKQQWNNNNVPVAETNWGINQTVDPHLYGEASVDDGIPQSHVYKDHYIDLKDLVTTYSFTGDSSIANNEQYLEHNGLYLIACTDYISETKENGPNPLPQISGSWRLCYLP